MAGPYRIRYSPSKNDLGMVSNDTESSPVFTTYLDRLMRMIPGEITALYLIGAGFIPAEERVSLVLWAVVCVVGLIALRAYGSQDKTTAQGPQWSSVAISASAFIVWLYSLGGPFAAFNLHIPYIGSLLVLAWTFFVPIFYRGEPVNIKR